MNTLRTLPVVELVEFTRNRRSRLVGRGVSVSRSQVILLTNRGWGGVGVWGCGGGGGGDTCFVLLT